MKGKGKFACRASRIDALPLCHCGPALRAPLPTASLTQMFRPRFCSWVYKVKGATMSAVVLAFLVFGVAFAFNGIGSTDSDEDRRDEEDPPPPDNPSTNVFRISDGATINGSGQDDVFSLSDDVDGDFTAELNGGAGDDTFNLTRPDGSAYLISGSLDGGAGNDHFEVNGERTDLRGGGGNDTVFGDLLGGSVYGGGGDDLLRISAGPGDPVLVYGDAGDDRLDGRGSDNIVLEGGAGDDLIVTDGAASGGAGYNIIARGGAGDDTLSHSVDVFPPLGFLNDVPARLTGGAGADTFSINLTIGEGSFEASPDDPEVFTTPAGLLEDFERGTDSLTIDLSAIDDTYGAVSARMIEDASTGTTDIILGLSDDTNPPHDIVIRVVATGMSWDDVTFSGRDPTFLNAA